MPDKSDNLIIIGAVISLFSSLLTLLLSNAYHWISKNRDREWLIEDRKYQRRLEVLSSRLKEVENCVNKYLDIATKLFDYEIRLVVMPKHLSKN